MSDAEVGREIELRAVHLLEAQGYRVHRSVRTAVRLRGRWMSHSNDVFGCVDIIAKRAGERMRYIQVCTASIGRKKEKLALVPWDADRESVEIWRWVGGTGKRIDGRTGEPRARLYFQVYRLERGFELDKSDRIWPKSR